MATGMETESSTKEKVPSDMNQAYTRFLCCKISLKISVILHSITGSGCSKSSFN